MEWLIYVGAGAVSGLLAGLFGAGGGMLIVPALLIALPAAGVDSPELLKISIATTMAVIIPTAIASSRAHGEKNGIDYKALVNLAPGVIIGAACGAMAAAASHNRLILVMFIVLMGRAALGMLFMSSQAVLDSGRQPLPGAMTLSAKGAGIGALSSVIGIGGATLVTPLLARYVPMRRAIGTSAILGLIISGAAAVGYAFAPAPIGCHGCMGYIYLPAVGAVGVAAVLTAPLGARLAYALPVPILQRAFGAILLIVIANMCAKSTLPRDVMVLAQALTGDTQSRLPDVKKYMHDRIPPDPAPIGNQVAARDEATEPSTRNIDLLRTSAPPADDLGAIANKRERVEEIRWPATVYWYTGPGVDSEKLGVDPEKLEPATLFLPRSPWPMVILAPESHVAPNGEPLYSPRPTSNRTANVTAGGWRNTPWPDTLVSGALN